MEDVVSAKYALAAVGGFLRMFAAVFKPIAECFYIGAT
jgi:hypothetical protein